GVAMAAHAQTDTTELEEMPQRPPMPEIPTQFLVPFVIKATLVSNYSPFAQTNLNTKDIAKGNLGQDLPYLLQYTPSAVVTSDAGTGIGYTGVRVRGTDGTRINVTLNGVPVNDP